MDIISVTFCFNNSYCPLAAGAISSLIRHTTSKYKYVIYIIQDDISDYNKYLINTLNVKDNVQIVFKEIEFAKLTNEDLNYNARLTKYAFGVLFLHRIFPNLEKILYLDGDIIITSDIAELFNQSLEGHAIGGCLDPIAINDLERLKSLPSVKSIQGFEAGSKNNRDRYDYYNKYLNLTDEQISTYLNSGVLLIDLKKAGRGLELILPSLLKKQYVFLDQDILNIAFKNDKKILDQRFNVTPEFLFKFIYETYTCPVVIHYTVRKPTDNMSKQMAYHYWWEEIAQTKFYYPALEHLIDKKDLDLEVRLYKRFHDEQELNYFYNNLKRINKLQKRRKFIRLIIKPLVDSRKYKKLKKHPARFFEDSKSSFIRYLGRFYI